MKLFESLNKNLGSSHRYTGFTLSEVIITLGIIGVLASLTIPNLINNINEAQYKAAAKKAFSVSAAAVTQMKLDQGDGFQYYIDNAQSFKPVFMTYFKVIKNCGLYSYLCVSASTASSVYKSLSNIPANTTYLDDGQFTTSDGMFFAIDNPDGSPFGNHVWIIVDVNGYTKKPNTFGKDVFSFQLLNNNLLPMGSMGTNLSVSAGYCDKNDTQSRTSLQGLGCMHNVMQDIDY